MKQYAFSLFATPYKEVERSRGMISKITRLMGIGVVSTIFILALLVTQASAAITSSNNINPQVFSDGAVHTLEVTGGGATSLTFNCPNANCRVAILFNAECSVDALDTGTWVDITILVDGAAVAPSSSDNAFCTSNDTGSPDSWVSASTNVVRSSLGAGNHTVQVRGQLIGFGAGDQWRIDDISLIVIR